MTDKSTENELQELRAQVAKLSRIRKAEDSKQQTDEAKGSAEQDDTEPLESTTTDVLNGENEREDEIGSHLRELVETLEEEIKDTNPLTMLVIFALGLLIGRLLPR